MSRRLPRRQFLKAGSAAAVGAAIAGLVPQRLFAAGPDNVVLSVGYAPLPAEGTSVRLAAAEQSLSGDPAFISRGARVSVSAYHRAAKYDGKSGGHTLAAIFPALGYEPSRYPRFNAASAGHAAVRFNMPVTAMQGVQFAVRQLGAKSDTLVALTFGSRSDVPSESLPSWSAQTLRMTNGELVVDTTAFSYVVVRTDYAS
jgi:hypothetical protein